MVIDFHTHAFPDAIAERAIDSLVKGCGGRYVPCSNGTVSGLLENMDAFGVDVSVIQPVITKPSQLETLNRWAKDIESERIISFGAVHPDTDDYKRDIDFICGLGFKGLKFHPEYQHFTLDDEKMLKIYDYAIQKGLILLFHAGFDPAFPPPYHSNPKMFADVYKKLGGGTIVAAHLGGQKQWDEVEEHICGTDIYIDTSMGFEYYSKEQFMRIVKSHGADKILFGSDSPWSKADYELECIRSLPLTDEERELILSGNARRLLGI